MHIPNHFKIEDPLIIDQFIQDHGFATLISQGYPYPLATHIPLELESLPSGIRSLVFKRVPGVANGMDYALQLTPEGGVRWTSGSAGFNLQQRGGRRGAAR